ncbi:MAG: hfsB [Brevundimonas sp.]|uniref:hfsB n=1 Tax=Brevundimonas sp. TaxID=1871086 RepID=UPI0025C33D51|nr:hfsB [Brevundimonas sp.]MBX3476055.1 hfsB [Brevundimonas sp.]
MVDLTSEMAGLWAALGPAPQHRGRVIQFVAAGAGEGVSTVSREFARLAAVRARKPVWLVDGDLLQQGQLEAAAAEADRFGRLGRPALASPDGSSFFAVTPRVMDRQNRPVAPARLLTARPCLGGRLWITRFATETLRSGQRVEVVGEPGYWDALRRHADTVVIDAPAADRNDMAITLAPFVDATIIVVAAETTAAHEPVILRDEIEAVGGRIAGVVVNRSTYRPPAFLTRLTG